MQILNVPVEYLTQQYSLGNMGELALVSWCPESIVIGDHDYGADQQHQDESGDGPEIPIAGSPPGAMVRIPGDRPERDPPASGYGHLSLSGVAALGAAYLDVNVNRPDNPGRRHGLTATAEMELFSSQLLLGGSRRDPTLREPEFQLGSRVAPAG